MFVDAAGPQMFVVGSLIRWLRQWYTTRTSLIKIAPNCQCLGNEVAKTLLEIKISVSTAQGREWAASGRGTLCV